MDMLSFIHPGIVVFSFVVFVVWHFGGTSDIIDSQINEDKKDMLDNKKEKPSIWGSFTFYLFLSTFTLIPYIQYQMALSNVSKFHMGVTLLCNSSDSKLNNQEYVVNKKLFKTISKTEFMHKEIGIKIRADRCEEK